MKKVKLIVISLVLLSRTALVAADEEPDRTRGLFNGRYWKAVGINEKLGYVIGFDEGIAAAQPSREKRDQYSAPGTFRETIEGIDDVYGKPENASLPISVAIRVFTMKVRGVPPDQIETQLAAYRKFYNSLSQVAPAAVKKPAVKEEPFRRYEDAKGFAEIQAEKERKRKLDTDPRKSEGKKATK